MITASIEAFDDCIEELMPMFPLHWEELGIFKDKMPLNPDYNVYRQREAMGQLIMPILRKDGKIIGYWPTFIAPGLHYKSTLTATMDILWLHPDHRGDGAGKLLADCVKTELKRRSVKLWYAGSKNHKQIEWFFKMLGFDPIESMFAMWIGD